MPSFHERNTQGETLESRAMRMAALHKVKRQTEGKLRLLDRLKTQRILLHDAYLMFVRISEAEELQSYGVEWMLDNYYIVQQAVRQIREDMPESFYRQLPKLDNTRLAGYPRVYAIARELAIGAKARLDIDQVEHFINGYQNISPLTMGELWAIPTMLRFSILELLTLASTQALEINTLDEGSPGDVFPPDITPDTIVANCITSLRTISIQDWKTFFEHTSLVEQVLNNDPAGVYPRMDFASRDQYRKVIENISLSTQVSEVDTARLAVALAQQARAQSWVSTPDKRDQRYAHVGYYLLDQGCRQLEARVGYKPDWKRRIVEWLLSHPTFTYLAPISFVTLLFVLGLYLYAADFIVQPWRVWAILLLSVIPVVSLTVSLVNWVFTHILSPRILPKLDFSEGIPAEYRTMVVIPAILTSHEEITSLLKQLELHFLRNNDPNLAFALLTDYLDAPEEHMEEDEALREQIVSGIEGLRKRYANPNRKEPFFLFHRERQLNRKEGVWMGWERKRGKLMELNHLLTGQGGTSFTTQVGNLKFVLPVRYIITLDSDTVLPQGGAARLTGTLAHPLNTAQFELNSDCIVNGYTVLQPRTEIQPTSANRTRFTRVFSGDGSLDLYTNAVSDVYQDLFGEGSYVGKGIYDVAAFSRSLEGLISENQLLSHDLLEGILGRAGLVTDTILYEEYPPTYQAFIRRVHRWIRGDWQLLPWLFSSGRKCGKSSSTISLIDRWKILDNLRRSLYAPTLLFFLIFGWLWGPGSPLFWTLMALLVSFGPVFAGTAALVAHHFHENTPLKVTEAERNQLTRWLLSLVFLPYEALVTANAIILTLVRMLITRRKLLEWTPSASVSRVFGGSENSKLAAWQEMFWAVLLSTAVVILTIFLRPTALPLVLPFALLWIFSPQVSIWLSKAFVREKETVAPEKVYQVRSLARRTWYFFEQFVNPGEHWLPPDHFQESPRGQVAHHTSATNIGLGFLSTLGAYDLGYIGFEECLVRLSNMLNAVEQMDKYRGHLLNWYDTQTLNPLPPRYVSTVDSGNLAGAMIAMRQGLNEMPQAPLLHWQRWEGLLDALTVFEETIDTIEENGAQTPQIQELCDQLQALRERILNVEGKVNEWPLLLRELQATTWPEVEKSLVAVIEAEAANLEPALFRSMRIWAERIRYQLSMMSRQQQDFTPWIPALAAQPALLQQAPDRSALAQAWQELLNLLPEKTSLTDLVRTEEKVESQITSVRELLIEDNLPSNLIQEAMDWCNKLSNDFAEAAGCARQRLDEIQTISERLEKLVRGMDFSFLYNPQRNIFHIGYNLDAEQMDNNYYDLLESEARIASLVAIAKGDVPQRHWLYLSRPLTQVDHELALLSWSGTMFEYLMPPLLLREYPNTLLNQSSYAAIQQQISYAQEREVPWGISESGFYYFDANQNYQYRAFGVPGLGFKRGLSDDLVIAPYASLLALPFMPESVVENVERLKDLQALTDYGFFEFD